MFIRVTADRGLLLPINEISVCKEVTETSVLNEGGHTLIIMKNASAYTVTETLSQVEGLIQQALDYNY